MILKCPVLCNLAPKIEIHYKLETVLIYSPLIVLFIALLTHKKAQYILFSRYVGKD